MLYYLHSGLLLILQVNLRSGSYPLSNLGLRAQTAGDWKKKLWNAKFAFCFWVRVYFISSEVAKSADDRRLVFILIEKHTGTSILYFGMFCCLFLELSFHMQFYAAHNRQGVVCVCCSPIGNNLMNGQSDFWSLSHSKTYFSANRFRSKNLLGVGKKDNISWMTPWLTSIAIFFFVCVKTTPDVNCFCSLMNDFDGSPATRSTSIRIFKKAAGFGRLNIQPFTGTLESRPLAATRELSFDTFKRSDDPTQTDGIWFQAKC